MEKYIKYVPLSLFILATAKALIITPTWSDAPLLIILASISAFYEYKNQEKKMEVLHKRCDAIDVHLSTLYKGQEEFKSYASALKLGQLRNTNVK